ncbi:MAG: ribonuclease HII [Treponema sp.]|nr:ribonuclease HII [Treponema sp.]
MEFDFFAGLDEAGRGPLAGPVSAGCVILSPDFPVELLNDSKKLTEKKREKILPLIEEKCCYGLAFVDHAEIDRENILQASLKAMKLAYEEMVKKLPEWCARNGIEMISDVDFKTALLFVPLISNIPCLIFSATKSRAYIPSS